MERYLELIEIIDESIQTAKSLPIDKNDSVTRDVNIMRGYRALAELQAIDNFNS